MKDEKEKKESILEKEKAEENDIIFVEDEKSVYELDYQCIKEKKLYAKEGA